MKGIAARHEFPISWMIKEEVLGPLKRSTRMFRLIGSLEQSKSHFLLFIFFIYRK